MKINNGLSVPLTRIGISVNFADKDDQPINGTQETSSIEGASEPGFFYRVLSMTNIDSVDPVSNSGSIAPGTEAVIKWLIIPTKTSGGSDPNGVEYKVGASLNYNDGDTDKAINVIPDSIFVFPMPDLKLDYFLPQYAYGDDPDTPGIVEAPIPFNMGFRVQNIGAGVANNLSLTTGQPSITENGQVLLAGFSILGSEFTLKNNLI